MVMPDALTGCRPPDEAPREGENGVVEAALEQPELEYRFWLPPAGRECGAFLTQRFDEPSSVATSSAGARLRQTDPCATPKA
jgi:hypothetical protein